MMSVIIWKKDQVAHIQMGNLSVKLNTVQNSSFLGTLFNCRRKTTQKENFQRCHRKQVFIFLSLPGFFKHSFFLKLLLFQGYKIQTLPLQIFISSVFFLCELMLHPFFLDRITTGLWDPSMRPVVPKYTRIIAPTNDCAHPNLRRFGDIHMVHPSHVSHVPG